MMSNRPSGAVFHEGDEVVLAEGTYQGTLGVFVWLRQDVNWADITERNGSIRSHPGAWVEPFHSDEPRFRGLRPAEPEVT